MPTVVTDVGVLGAVAEPVRWQIVQLLAGEQLCVCHLVEELGIPQSLVSHHLKVLKDAGLVRGERFRYWTYYSMTPGALVEVADRLRDLADREPPASRRPCC